MLIRFLAPALCALAVTACSKEHAPAAPTPARAPPVAEAAASTPAANDAGASVYNKTCFVCHGSGAGGAPTLGAREDWAPRVAQGKDTLHKHAIEGFNGEKGVMPAKGGNLSLSEDDVKAAVDYIISKSQ
ncbi:c-type cytochrome [Steroidobacter flavus]|uniref:C-type cytochrome n=1 Tax=Steroidobacter flavus TaxID=1842136 RepID=A0ABV8SZ30_9GAMM